jgi:hypothetical protein
MLVQFYGSVKKEDEKLPKIIRAGARKAQKKWDCICR